jgi:hypothetical protein
VIAVLVFSVLDPSNGKAPRDGVKASFVLTLLRNVVFASPTTAPLLLGASYFVIITAFAVQSTAVSISILSLPVQA